MIAKCRGSIVMGSVVDQWHMSSDCNRAWVQVCSKYGWYCMHEKLVQGLGHAREKYGKLLVQWGESCSMLARSREKMVARRGLDCWWLNNWSNGKWAHLCNLVGKARAHWEQEQERLRGREREREQEQERRWGDDSEGWEATD